MPSRPSVEAPPHRPKTWRAEPSRNFPFLFRRFFQGRAQKKNCKGKFLRGCRRSDSGGGRRGGSFVRIVREKVRISSKQYRQFTISAFWEEIASALRASAGALRAPKPHFARVCHAPRGEKETAWFWIWKFVWAKPKAKRSFANQSFFVSPKAKHGSDNFNILTA